MFMAGRKPACFICMVGNDYRRILDGVNHWLREFMAEVLYLLYDVKQDKYGYVSRKNVEDLRRAFMALGIKTLRVGFNPQSFENVFCTLYRILRMEVDDRKRRVIIDTTSTTKEAYGATVTVSLMFKDVSLYIVPPKERGWYVPSPEAPTFMEWFERTRNVEGLTPVEIYLPGQRLSRPNDDETMVLLRLKELGGSSSTMAMVIKGCGMNPDDPVARNRFSRIATRLEKKGLLVRQAAPPRKQLSLTTFGRILAEAIG
jgi:hypothetical protein